MKSICWLLACVFVIACNDGAVQVMEADEATPADLGQRDARAGDGGSDSGQPTFDLARPSDVSTSTPDVTSTADSNVPPDAAVPPTESAGCVDGNGIPEGENTLTLGGLDRRYIMRLPANYTRDKAWPLVLALHGNGGSAAYWDVTTGDRNIRGVLQDDAVLIIAEAIGGNWRDYAADPATWPGRIDDELNYFDEVVSQARNELCINESAIFSMGFSGGGSFSGVLGCMRDYIRAIAVGGSVIYFDRAACTAAPAAWITIGTLELVAGREEYRDFFRDHSGCDATATAVAPDPCTAYDNCNPATPVQYCQHPGDHIWPDFGSQAMWDFFTQFID